MKAIIIHDKHDFRMLRNYLKGVTGDTINLLLAAAFNFRKWMRATALIFFVLFFVRKFLGFLSPRIHIPSRSEA